MEENILNALLGIKSSLDWIALWLFLILVFKSFVINVNNKGGGHDKG